ncbi:unnamed protein product [Ostreobium quekettii]|uniref:Acyl-coenzyme A oxidase n=1 Tax=Ostreobium quekettii TaxID=121088 RepID=A0A8S1IRV7_9CHLO|nr:unnamed protein product [Ostreobium quekettii]
MAMFVDARTRALQAASTDAVLPSSSDPVADLAAERRRAGFDVAELMRFLHGGQERIDRKARLAEMLQKTDWGNKSRRYFMTTEEQYVAGLQVAFGIRELVKEHGLSEADRRLLALMVALPGGLDVHDLMFVPCFIDHGTEEQQEKWVERARNCEVIGAYAQTELGHGTFVRGLETTATYDPERAEFILHSPTLTSTKWWPGGLGKTASHCILTARLFVKGVDRGPHVFVVQLRSMEDHKPLPGIMLGDIGPKFAYRGVDNGFLRFDHVRVPRDAMLMRFAKVTPGGEYVPPTADNAKSTYATMMYVRCGLAGDSARHLAMAVTIAVRYCAVRRQTAPSPGLKETQVLDYQSVSGTLLPLIATSFALHFSGKAAMASYHDFERRRDTGDFDGLAELHALSAGLKALCTWVTADGIEACRRSCGGHGYSRLSGLPDLYGFYVKNVTLEGENKVLCLQVGRHLIKALLAAQSGRPLRGAAAYLSDGFFEMSQLCAVDQRARWLDHGVQAEAFRRAAVQAVASAADLLREEGGGEVAFEGAVWNACNEAVIK